MCNYGGGGRGIDVPTKRSLRAEGESSCDFPCGVFRFFFFPLTVLGEWLLRSSDDYSFSIQASSCFLFFVTLFVWT